jgi:predicted ATPase/DNA-binding SARP family transcriptional activator
VGLDMDVRILGPLEVLVDGAPAALGGAKPRALLAVLAVARGAVVPVDTLVEALWEAEPPAGAISSVRAYVSRLRVVLEAGGERRRLHFRGGGYLLEVDDDELDVATVERLLAAARTADAEHAVTLLDDALGRWRGDALAEFAGLDPVRAEVGRLAELRLTAAEERADALLRAGRGAEAVADLEVLVAAEPHRERAAVLLMRALYATGRQADAMAVFHALRRRLDDELGVPPSEPARALYQRILDQDPALAPPPTPVPGNLPRRATAFVGRGPERDTVAAALRRGPLVTLTGVGGVGKSRLAEEVAGRERDRFPDGVWLAELAPLPDGGPVGHAVSASLRVQQRQGMGIDESLIAYLRPRRLLLLLDNCEHVLDGAARFADRVVTQCPGVAVLATSRAPLDVPGEQVRPVPPLSIEDATALFVHRARAQRPDVEVGPQERSVAEICRRLDGLPLAIELAAARTRAMSVSDVARRLDGGRLLSGGPRVAEPRHQSLAAAIGWSYELVGAAERALFSRLSVFAGGFDLDAAHGVCGAAGAAAADTLDLLTVLVDHSMVVPVDGSAASRYRLLETLRAYGRERLREAGDEIGTARRHARYFVDLVERAAAGVQGPDERAWVERLLPDHDNLRAVFARARDDGDADLVLRLVSSLPEVVHIRVGYESAVWAEQSLDLAAGHPRFVEVAGGAARGAWARADFAHARRLAELAGGRAPRRGAARIAHPGDVLADVALYEGDVEAARRHYEAEVAVARVADDPLRLVWTLYYLAICCAVQRASGPGLAAARESLEVAATTGNPTAESMARYALGLVQKWSDPARALELFDEAARLAADVQNFWWEGIALMEAAATRGVHGDPDAAAADLTRVLDHWDRVGDWTQQWLNLRYVVRLLARTGADTEAVVLHHCLLAAGKPSPLGAERLARMLDGPSGPRFAAAAAAGRVLSGPDAVTLARARLRRPARTG